MTNCEDCHNRCMAKEIDCPFFEEAGYLEKLFKEIKITDMKWDGLIINPNTYTGTLTGIYVGNNTNIVNNTVNYTFGAYMVDAFANAIYTPKG